MNVEQLLNQVEEAIKNRPVSAAKRFWLCYKDGDFRCVPMAAHPSNGIVLETYGQEELTKGLTTKQWGRLLTKLAKIKVE